MRKLTPGQTFPRSLDDRAVAIEARSPAATTEDASLGRRSFRGFPAQPELRANVGDRPARLLPDAHQERFVGATT